MANYEINEEQEVLTKAMRMIETGDPVHADIYNALFSALLNNDVFLEKLANKMVQQAMVSHVMDSTNSNMVLGADQGPVITKLIDKVQEQVTVLNTNQENFIAKLGPYAFLESNNIDDYNEKALENIYRILYGIIDNQAYLSIDIAWVRIQFCTNIQTLKWRIVYGSSGTDGWHSFS